MKKKRKKCKEWHNRTVYHDDENDAAWFTVGEKDGTIVDEGKKKRTRRKRESKIC